MSVTESSETRAVASKATNTDRERQTSLMERYNALRWVAVVGCPEDTPEMAMPDHDTQQALMMCYNG